MKNLFTVSQVTKSCGVSRATLLRLESRGLLSPALIDEKNGFRYFDNYNVTKILQIKHLLAIGLSYAEIYEYFSTNGTSVKLLSSLEQKMIATKRMYDEMNLRITKKPLSRLKQYLCPIMSAMQESMRWAVQKKNTTPCMICITRY